MLQQAHPLLPPPAPQTKSLVQTLEKVGAPAAKKTLLVTAALNEEVMRAGRNIEKLAINTADALQVGLLRARCEYAVESLLACCGVAARVLQKCCAVFGVLNARRAALGPLRSQGFSLLNSNTGLPHPPPPQVFDILNADVLVFEKAALEKVKQLYAPKAESA